MSPATYPADSPAQERLTELFDARSARVGRRPPDPGQDPAALEAAREAARESTALVLLRSVDLADLVHGTVDFAAGLDRDEADAWQWSWTRTRFLFGNPANLTGRTPARVVAPHGSTAWLGPFPAGRLPGVSRLLKPVTGSLPDLPAVVDLPAAGTARDAAPTTPGPGRPRELRCAVRDLTFSEYLVHLHHTLAESVLLGRLRPGEPLRLIHLPDIDPATVREEPGYARVHYAPGDPTRLRLYTCLS